MKAHCGFRHGETQGWSPVWCVLVFDSDGPERPLTPLLCTGKVWILGLSSTFADNKAVSEMAERVLWECCQWGW